MKEGRERGRCLTSAQQNNFQLKKKKGTKRKLANPKAYLCKHQILYLSPLYFEVSIMQVIEPILKIYKVLKMFWQPTGS